MTQPIEIPGQGIVEFPDEMNDQQIAAAIKKNMLAPQTNRNAAIPVPLDVGMTLGSRTGASVLGGLSGLVTGNPENVGKVQQALSYEPRTAAGEKIVDLASKPGEFIANKADQAAEYLREKLNLSPSVAAGINTTLQAAPQALLSKGLPPIMKARAPGLLAAESKNLIPDTQLKTATDLGAKFAPSEVSSSNVGSLMEGVAGKIKTQQGASIHNQSNFTDVVAKKELGLPPDLPITPENLHALKQPQYDAYKAFAGVGRVTADEAYFTKLDSIKSKYEGAAKDFKSAASHEVKTFIDDLKQTKDFDAASGIDQISILRDEASTAFKQGNDKLGFAKKEAARALEDMIDRHTKDILTGQPGPAIANYRAARKKLAQINAVEDAMYSGHVSARDLAAQMDKGVPLSGGLRTIAETYRRAPKSMQNLTFGGTPIISPMEAGIAGTMAAVMHHPKYLAAMAASPIARFTALSKPFQKAFVKPPSYEQSILETLRKTPIGLEQTIQKPPFISDEKLREMLVQPGMQGVRG